MRSFCVSTLVALLLFSSAYACEEVCKSGTISKLMDKYTTDVLEPYFARKEEQFQVPHSLDPLRHAIQLECPDVLNANVFGYFRGKCQRNGIEPKGCPNPDCPSRCGTPGSMVHFFPKLRRLGFESIRTVIKNHTDPTSPTYKQIQARVEQGRELRKKGAPMRFQPRTYGNRDIPISVLYMRQPFEIHPKMEDVYNHKRSGDSDILHEFVPGFEASCGYKAEESGTDLKNCSWEAEMKNFILQFP
ncbi:hypothetical protein E1B28_006162 [Marasmius oreades]|uniref:Uncharacterized protein n=1 Tax=Marasmius oreades TaxID=181124 RepID=A0A9P7S7F3_9AGAR|nr:uncharacterized protein E1B28_006162 [Marasmius oreades]KAG7095413.1 hypothetical protein E1B28_006162 [Marasmius oreades]